MPSYRLALACLLAICVALLSIPFKQVAAPPPPVEAVPSPPRFLHVRVYGGLQNYTYNLPLAFSPDGLTLASADHGSVSVWNVATGERLKANGLAIAEPHSTHPVVRSHDDRFLAEATGPHGWQVKLMPRDAAPVLLEETLGRVHSMAFSPDGTRLAVNYAGETQQNCTEIGIWNLQTFQFENLIGGHTSQVFDVKYTRDGRWLLSSGNDGRLMRRDLRTEKVVRPASFSQNHWHAHSIGLSPDDRTALTCTGGCVRGWSVATGQAIFATPVNNDDNDPASQATYSPDGKAIAASGPGYDITLMDAQGTVTGTLRGATSIMRHVVFHADGKRLLSLGGGSYVLPSKIDRMSLSQQPFELLIWDLTTRSSKPLAKGLVCGTRDLAVLPDGKTVAFLGHGNAVILWDIERDAEVRTLAAPFHTARFAVHPTGKWIAGGGYRNDVGAVWLWDTATGEVIDRAETEKDQWVECLSFAADGCELAVGTHNRRIYRWKMK